jgi:hypothetical protein
MKLRVKGQSIRVRLDQLEVSRLAEGHIVENSTKFSRSSQLVCTLEASSLVDHPTATFAAGDLKLRLPANAVRTWARSTDQVSIESQQAIDRELSLHILIEKDFQCLHRRTDEDFHAFPNPKKSAGN